MYGVRATKSASLVRAIDPLLVSSRSLWNASRSCLNPARAVLQVPPSPRRSPPSRRYGRRSCKPSLVFGSGTGRRAYYPRCRPATDTPARVESVN